MIDSSSIGKARDIITYEDFFDSRHQAVFRSIEWLDKQGMGIDLLTVTDALKKFNLLIRVGGSTYLSEMMSRAVTSVNILTYAKMVADDAAKRKIAAAAREIEQATADGSTLEEALEKVKSKVAEVNGLGGKQNKYQVSSMVDHIDEAQERFKHWGEMQGLSTGFPSIDQLTLGLVGGELIIVAGQTSKGKTTLSMNIANRVAQTGVTVLFVTLEMTHAELTSRYMFINGGAHTAGFATAASNTIYQQNDELDWKDIDGLIQNAKEQLDVGLVIIDHLHYFSRDLQNMSEDLGRITKEFKKNAIRYNIPIVLISHVRKMGKDEELTGEALRGSSLIAQDSDIVLLVGRDPETNDMGVIIDKNRNRGKLSDRTRDWGGKDEREINTVILKFDGGRLIDPLKDIQSAMDIFPGATVVG